MRVGYGVDSSLVVLRLVPRLMSSWCTQMEREVAWGLVHGDIIFINNDITSQAIFHQRNFH